MAYRVLINETLPMSAAGKILFNQELDLLRAELDDIRAKYAATLTKLDADAGVTDVNYGSLGALVAKQFVPNS